MGANTELTIQQRKATENDTEYLQRIEAELDQDVSSDDMNAVVGRISLIAEKYSIQYVAKKKLTQKVTMNPIITDLRQFSAGKALTFPIAHQPLAGAKLKPGGGVNVQF